MAPNTQASVTEATVEDSRRPKGTEQHQYQQNENGGNKADEG